MGSTHHTNANKPSSLPVTSEEIAFEIAEAARRAQAERTAGLVRIKDLAEAFKVDRHVITRRMKEAGVPIVKIKEYGQSTVNYVDAKEAKGVLA